MNTKILFKLLLFIGIGCLLFSGVERLFSVSIHSRVPADIELKESIKAFEKKAADTNVLILGDSEVYYGVNPNFIEVPGLTIHNFGFPSEPVTVTHYKIKHYLDTGMLDNLKLVLISFNSRRDWEGIASSRDYYEYFDYSDILWKYGPIKFLETVLNQSHAIRLQSFFLGFVERWAENDLDIRPAYHQIFMENGYGAITKTALSYEKDYDEIHDYMQENVHQCLETQHNVTIKAYRSFVDMLHEKNVQVVFFDMPTAAVWAHPEHMRICNTQNDKMHQAHFSEIPYLNFNRPLWWQPKHFADRGHLNIYGSMFLGKKLSELLQPLVH